MIISHEKRFIYIKANKVAGTSTEILLDSAGRPSDIVTEVSKVDLPETDHNPRNFEKEKFYNHITARAISEKLGRNVFDGYFRFMNIRNPWERLVSAYFWRRRNQANAPIFEEWVQSAMIAPLSVFGTIDGQWVLSDVIRFEHLEEDTMRIFKKIGIRAGLSIYPRAKTHQNPRVSHYTEFFNRETQSLVERRYSKDIEKFGYRFGK